MSEAAIEKQYEIKRLKTEQVFCHVCVLRRYNCDCRYALFIRIVIYCYL